MTGLEQITKYSGTWKADVETFDTPYSMASTSSRIIRNNCWAPDGFSICYQTVDGEPKAVIVYTHDADSDVYHTCAVVPGSVKGCAGGTLVVKGNEWTYPSVSTENGRSVQFRVVNVFSSPTTIEFRREYSEDGISWKLIAKGREERRS